MVRRINGVSAHGFYRQADPECRNRIVGAAAELLKAQKSLKNKPGKATGNGEK